MKLLFVHQHLGAFGGAEENILLSGVELLKRGHTVALMHQDRTGKGEAAWEQTFTPRIQLPEDWDSSSLQESLQRIHPDLIYLHNFPGLELIEQLLDSEAPVVRMAHDHNMYCMRSYKYNYFTRTICNRPTSLHCVFPCLAMVGRNPKGGFPFTWVSYRNKLKEIQLNRRCRRLVVYSEFAKDQLVRNGFNPNQVQIHVPIKCWGTDGEVSSFSERNLVLYAGQLIRGKGVDLLLEALSKVRVPFECIILGDGNHRRYCERLSAQLGLEKRVQFRGYVPPSELKQYYLESSVFAMSSVWPEPFGMAGPEAMRYGLPVVAFDAGAISEWLTDGENGYLAPWMDTDLYAARLEKLLTDKHLARQMGRRGLERVNKDYNSVRQIDKLESLFLEVQDEHRLAGTPQQEECTV